MGDPPRAKGPNGTQARDGQDRLVDLGGHGTPRVQELCLPELAIARRVHTLSALTVLHDALDLRHRLPATFAVVLAGECEVWVAPRIAAMSRRLEKTQAGLLDAAVADSIAGDFPSRVLALAEAKIIEADLAGHLARLEPGHAVWVEAMVDRIADILTTRTDLTERHDLDKQALRALALGRLAHPAAVLDLPIEAFPHATRSSRRTEMDHPVPYDPLGAPAQTRDTNAAPLSRTHHRAKTHTGWQIHQTSLDHHYWRTPHGLCRATRPAGTAVIDNLTHWHATHPGALNAALDATEKTLRR